MKVLTIHPKQTQADNKPYWKITLQGSRIPLIVWDAPQFSIGDDLDISQLIPTGEGDRQTYSLKADSRTEQISEKDASIREQTAIKALIDIFNAGKIKEFQVSDNYLVKNIREWIEVALIHGPIMQNILGQGAKVHPLRDKVP